MEKKYQFFISSTYEDLKEERAKAIQTILSMEQFPIGMELFSAADEDQWTIISQTIDTSDYYVLIIGRRYGSIIPEGNVDAGISYTEKEFNYAVSRNIPVLAFILSDGARKSNFTNETSDKISKLDAFKEKVKTSRYVKFFKNPDEFASLLSQSIHKALQRKNRPGWIRTTEFSIEESHAMILQLTERIHTLEALNADLRLENDRKPDLILSCHRDPENEDEDGNLLGNEPDIKNGEVHFLVKPVYMDDVAEKITYSVSFNREKSVSKSDVLLLRTFFQNGFSLLFKFVNKGTLRATGVRCKLEIPDGLIVVSNADIEEYVTSGMIGSSDKDWEERQRTMFVPEGCEASDEKASFLSVKELESNTDIANLLDSGDVVISPQEIYFEFSEIRHKESKFYRGAYFYPTKTGVFEIKCSILCNEIVDPIGQTIKIVVE